MMRNKRHLLQQKYSETSLKLNIEQGLILSNQTNQQQSNKEQPKIFRILNRKV